MSVNKAFILGNLGSDPDMKYMSDGRKVVTLSVATSSFYKNKESGGYETKVEWHRIVLFNNLAELAVRFLSKGSKVFVAGYIRNKKWEDKNGVVHYSYDIIANEIKFLSSKNKNVSDSEAEGIAKDLIEDDSSDDTFSS